MALRFHLKASPSLLVRAGQRSQGAHPAARMPLGAPGRLRHGSKTHSSFPAGVVPYGTVIILGSDPSAGSAGL